MDWYYGFRHQNKPLPRSHSAQDNTIDYLASRVSHYRRLFASIDLMTEFDSPSVNLSIANDFGLAIVFSLDSTPYSSTYGLV